MHVFPALTGARTRLLELLDIVRQSSSTPVSRTVVGRFVSETQSETAAQSARASAAATRSLNTATNA